MLSRRALAKKYKRMPGTMPVTYYVKTHSSSDVEGEDAGVTIAHARRRGLTYRQIATGAFAPAENYRNWDLWTDELGSIEPKPGDRLTDPDGVTWYVEGIGEGLLDQVKYLICRKARTRA